MHYIVIAQSELTARALCTSFYLLGNLATSLAKTERIVVQPRHREGDGGLGIYHMIVEKIDQSLATSAFAMHGSVAVVVDSVDARGMTAIAERMGWDHLIALLVLTFPEVKWFFGVVTGQDKEFPQAQHDLKSFLFRARRDPIFDPTGLREWIRKKTNATLKRLYKEANKELPESGRGTAMQLPVRKRQAAAVENEVDYAMAHGYAAYRYGYRADVITSWRLMEERFGLMQDEGHPYTLLMEDMRLNFADKPGSVHLSRLGSTKDFRGRDCYCPLLHSECDSSTWRFLITSGQSGRIARKGQMTNLVDENQEYLKYKTGSRRGEVLYKPVGGLIDLWIAMGLRKGLQGGTWRQWRDGASAAWRWLVKEDDLKRAGSLSSKRGNAEGFISPPSQYSDSNYSGHGAPGKLGMIARVLLDRAALTSQRASSANDWIRAALLASEAAELLGGKTPTSTLSALALKHECEVRAECAFVGAGFRFGVAERLDEIEDEVNSVCRWFHTKRRNVFDLEAKATIFSCFYANKRKVTEWNAKATIVNRLRLVFSEAGQMEEEEQCLVELRRLNRKMNRPKGWERLNPIHCLSHAILSYGEWLLGGFNRILVMTALWIVAVVVVAELNIGETAWKHHETISSVFGWFFGGAAASNPPAEQGPALAATVHYLSWCAIIVGVFHIGILISYLYSLISRR